jgi:hypothetical protein
MLRKIFVFVAAALVAICPPAHADDDDNDDDPHPHHFDCKGAAHTIHYISVGNNSGTGTCVLSALYGGATFCLVDADGTRLEGRPFALRPPPSEPVRWDLKVGPHATFNVEYALTCVADDGQSALSPKLMFLIGADGPAEPDVHIVGLHNASGAWISNGQGENYTAFF